MTPRSMRRAHQRRLRREQRRAATLGLLGVSLLAPGAAQAANLTVSSLADTATPGTLRTAITTATTNGQADTITITAPGTIKLASALPTITEYQDLTIKGTGRDTTTISGDTDDNGTPDVHILDVTANGASAMTVALSDLTLTKGATTASGGAINMAPTGTGLAKLALTDVTVSASKATGPGSTGGGIFSAAPVSLTRTTISGNTAASSGGGITTGALTVRDATITGNAAGATSSGGGASVSRSLDAQKLVVTNNQAGYAAGLYLESYKYDSTLSDVTITGNTATQYGGGAELIVEQAALQMDRALVSGNSAARGAGLALVSGSSGTVRIGSSAIRGNTGVGAASFGGGIALLGYTTDHIELVDSTVSGNTAAHGAGISAGYDTSGPVFRQGPTGAQLGSLDVDNSTIAGNTASAGGGGIYLSSYDAGSPSARRAATIGLSSTILADNTPQDADRADDATAGGLDAAFSLIEAPGDVALSASAVITGKDPQLGALGNNGGPTPTMLPGPTSPVIDQGKAPAKLTTDQRGLARTVDTGIANVAGGDGTDIGAVELPASAVTVPSASPSPAPSTQPTPALTVSVRGAPIAPGAPLLPAGLSPFDCAVTVVRMTSCDVNLRSVAKIKLTKKHSVPAGTLLAEAQPGAPAGAANLSGKAVLTSDGRAVLAKRPTGVDVRVAAVAAYGVGNALTAGGAVHLLTGPSVTLKLGHGKTLSKSVKSQLGTLGKLLTGTKTISVSATGPSKAKAAAQASAAGAALTKAGATAKPATAGKQAKRRRLTITFSY